MYPPLAVKLAVTVEESVSVTVVGLAIVSAMDAPENALQLLKLQPAFADAVMVCGVFTITEPEPAAGVVAPLLGGKTDMVRTAVCAKVAVMVALPVSVAVVDALEVSATVEPEPAVQ
jgi:hypothetical protein